MRAEKQDFERIVCIDLSWKARSDCPGIYLSIFHVIPLTPRAETATLQKHVTSHLQWLCRKGGAPTGELPLCSRWTRQRRSNVQAE